MKKALVWVRRDIRLEDHSALIEASKEADEVYPVFVFDTEILNKLSDKKDRRVQFLAEAVVDLKSRLNKKGSDLFICYGNPIEEIPKLAKRIKAEKVFSNRDYEPYAKARDTKVKDELKKANIDFEQFKDCVIFEKEEVLKGDGTLYKVFTPYKNRWLEVYSAIGSEADTKAKLKLAKFKDKEITEEKLLKKIGFEKMQNQLIGTHKELEKRLDAFINKIDHYKRDRDFVSIDGTSLLAVYIRHGLVSIRQLAQIAFKNKSTGSQIWLSELVWRDFYQCLLDAHPYVVNGAFKKEYDKIKWSKSKKNFEAWCKGETGFPIVDAAMRCLNETGLMHNRLRMITASFLCKILHINWQWGEEYFAIKLLDFDLAANNGGWQWCSSSGCDGQPYFRIFNPYTQSEKFDGQGEFIRKWVPELSELSNKKIHYGHSQNSSDLFNQGVMNYPQPIVDYKLAREECIEMYKKGLGRI